MGVEVTANEAAAMQVDQQRQLGIELRAIQPRIQPGDAQVVHLGQRHGTGRRHRLVGELTVGHGVEIGEVRRGEAGELGEQRLDLGIEGHGNSFR
ncbi:hypothetical protein D3C78_704160 [compost metagenome]